MHRRRHIGDFRLRKAHDEHQAALHRLLCGLKAKQAVDLGNLPMASPRPRRSGMSIVDKSSKPAAPISKYRLKLERGRREVPLIDSVKIDVQFVDDIPRIGDVWQSFS